MMPDDMRMIPLGQIKNGFQQLPVLQLLGSFDGIMVYRCAELKGQEIRFSAERDAIIIGSQVTLDDIRFEFQLNAEDWEFLRGCKVKV